MVTLTPTQQFCRILRERSVEHVSAGQLLYTNGYYGQVVSILRQELDSLVRAVFLLSLEEIEERQHYIQQTLNGEKWTKPNSRTQITDRQMVDLSDFLFGWTSSVYKLGCAFIHLSPMADYRNENPFGQLPIDEINDIKQHLNNYHGFPLEEGLSMTTIEPYLLRVLDKVSSNLEYYIVRIENGIVPDIFEL